jgi:hypothetical protein
LTILEWAVLYGMKHMTLMENLLACDLGLANFHVKHPISKRGSVDDKWK